MSLPLVIVNPASAGGATGDSWPRLASDLRTHFGPFSCEFTTRSGDAEELAASEARRGRRLVIACGGDGTINEVANGILSSGIDCELGILPSGTGGDFQRTLAAPARARDTARKLREGKSRRIDAGLVKFYGTSGESQSRYFLNVASFGMGGKVIKRVKENAWLSGAGRALGGRIPFAAAALSTAIEFTNPQVLIQLDDAEEFRLTIRNFCVANGRYFGGGMKVAPKAKLDDGLFDAVAIGDLGALTVLSNAYRVYLGTHLGMRDVHSARVTTVTARSASGGELIELELDGEVVGRLPARFEIQPGRLKLRSFT
jgi:diacylglycerol kinase (ATP)